MAERKELALILCAGEYERVHYAFVMAAAAAATARPVTIFFTMSALETLRAPATDGEPGWRNLAPGADQIAAAEKDAAHAQSGIATLEELISACAEFGARFLVCDMGLKAQGMTAADLRADLNLEISGMVGFLSDVESADARIIFI